jgi:hypothetical protein
MTQRPNLARTRVLAQRKELARAARLKTDLGGKRLPMGKRSGFERREADF